MLCRVEASLVSLCCVVGWDLGINADYDRVGSVWVEDLGFSQFTGGWCAKQPSLRDKVEKEEYCRNRSKLVLNISSRKSSISWVSVGSFESVFVI